MFREFLLRAPVFRDLREAISREAQRYETLRKNVAALEDREQALAKKLLKLEIGGEKLAPMLASVMREGVPLEIFARLALIDAGFSVRGYFNYHSFNNDGSYIERSVDATAARDRIYTVPSGQGPNSGKSWPERNHLLVETKQRRRGVRWIFCQLPGAAGSIPGAPADVPQVNFGYELRPLGAKQKDDGGTDLKPKPNTRDVENGIEQLEYTHLPKLVDIDREWTRDHPHATGRFAPGVRHDQLWCLLVTNARLMLFKPPKTLAELESEDPPKDDALFVEAPWLVFRRAPSLRLLAHQERHVANVPSDAPDRHLSTAVLMAVRSPEVHIVNFDRLSQFLVLVDDPPRLKQIVFQLSGPEGTKSSFKIPS